MDDLQPLLHAAFQKLLPTLLADPAALHARLRRRQSREFLAPGRHQCVALRANDRRLNPHHALIDDVPAYHARQPHLLQVTSSLLANLCYPARVDGRGLTIDKLAEQLGVHPNTISQNLRRNNFTARFIPGLAGRKGRPVPLVTRPGFWDPQAANNRSSPDPILGIRWQLLTLELPENFSQDIRRVPRPCRPDDPSLRRFGFKSWRWVCPACQDLVRTIYLPIPLRPFDFFLHFLAPHLAHEATGPTWALACTRCHDIRNFSWQNRSSWNHLILQLSAGLLFGHEVPKPASALPVRKRPFVHKGPQPTEKRAAVETLLLQGHTPIQIARQLSKSQSAIQWHARKIYKKYNTTNLHDFRNATKHLPAALPLPATAPRAG